MSHTFAAVFMFCCMLFCAVIFLILGVWALRRKDPMHFWSGSTVPPETIRDIPAYNRANGIMWLVYGALFLFGGLVSFFSVTAAGIAAAVITLGGLPVLVVLYRRIFNKYKA